ncbi:hypothetical protein VP01_731g4 [Puccinia sorghi]|uniref:Uncharacterized protein n=1 Tax=Puccinia sorghi TaxID=27349 RepID=A0A0L6UCU3_9BASI|nr:hypothetical protein VP01_731g4 [Puccinia sorghi]
MVTIADMSYDHFKAKHKSLRMNHLIFLMILHILLEFKYNFKKNWMSKRYIKDDNSLTWEIHQIDSLFSQAGIQFPPVLQSLVESLLEKGLSNNRSFQGFLHVNCKRLNKRYQKFIQENDVKELACKCHGNSPGRSWHKNHFNISPEIIDSKYQPETIVSQGFSIHLPVKSSITQALDSWIVSQVARWISHMVEMAQISHDLLISGMCIGSEGSLWQARGGISDQFSFERVPLIVIAQSGNVLRFHLFCSPFFFIQFDHYCDPQFNHPFLPHLILLLALKPHQEPVPFQTTCLLYYSYYKNQIPFILPKTLQNGLNSGRGWTDSHCKKKTCSQPSFHPNFTFLHV